MDTCRYDDRKRCYHSGHCSRIDASGSVSVCPLNPNADGFFTRRKGGISLVSPWSKHLKGKEVYR